MDDRFETVRMEAFSDGVFAIAITLLVLEISVPEDALENLWRGIADQWPSYLAYVTSFLTIGGLWIVHHGIFRRLRHATLALVRLNLVLLMVVSFLPFPTRLVADAIDATSAERAAVIFYGATLFAISFMITLIARYVARRGDLLHDSVDLAEVRAAAARVSPNLVFYALVLLFALVAPLVAAFGFFALSLTAVIPRRLERLGRPA